MSDERIVPNEDNSFFGLRKLNLGCGPHELDGFDNLNPPDWRFEDGLKYADGTVEAITISHALMYVAIADWPFVFGSFARVLEPGGSLRVTEDDTENPDSERYGDGVWHDAVTATGPKLVRKHMRAAGLVVNARAADETGFRDFTLCQALHGAPPKVFFLEGRKP